LSSIYVIDMKTNQKCHVFEGNSSEAKLSGDAKYMAYKYQSEAIKIFDFANKKEISRFEPEVSNVTSVFLSYNSNYIAYGVQRDQF